jgi:hypothetical protein
VRIPASLTSKLVGDRGKTIFEISRDSKTRITIPKARPEDKVCRRAKKYLGHRVDVMITIFCDFRQFSAKKIGVFLKNQCYDRIFA